MAALIPVLVVPGTTYRSCTSGMLQRGRAAGAALVDREAAGHRCTADDLSVTLAHDHDIMRWKYPWHTCHLSIETRYFMPGPLIFIATNRLREGRFDAERQRVPELVRFIEANEPRLIAFNEYVNEDRTEVTVVQVHLDAASMEYHMGVVAGHTRQAYAQTLESTAGVQVFGAASDSMLRMLREQAGSGLALSIHAQHLGGFMRTSVTSA